MSSDLCQQAAVAAAEAAAAAEAGTETEAEAVVGDGSDLQSPRSETWGRP